MESTTSKTRKQLPISPPLIISRKESFDQASSLKTQECSTQPLQETSSNATPTPSQISIQQKLVDQTILITAFTKQLANERNTFNRAMLQQNNHIQTLERDLQIANRQIQKLEAENKYINDMKDSITDKVHEVDQEKQELQRKCTTLETRLQQEKEENITLKAILTESEGKVPSKAKGKEEFLPPQPSLESQALEETPTLTILQASNVTRAVDPELKSSKSL